MRLLYLLVVAAGLLAAEPAIAHGGGLNACGCHFNRKTGDCHCHQNRGCGCECQPPSCGRRADEGAEPAFYSSAEESPFMLCKSTRVKGYTTKSGKYVAPHYRSGANRTKGDNFSTKGNVNPYTGKGGTRNL